MADSGGGLIRTRNVGVARYLHLPRVMRCEDRLQEIGDGVAGEVVGDVSHSQPAVGIGEFGGAGRLWSARPTLAAHCRCSSKITCGDSSVVVQRHQQIALNLTQFGSSFTAVRSSAKESLSPTLRLQAMTEIAVHRGVIGGPSMARRPPPSASPRRPSSRSRFAQIVPGHHQRGPETRSPGGRPPPPARTSSAPSGSCPARCATRPCFHRSSGPLRRGDRAWAIGLIPEGMSPTARALARFESSVTARCHSATPLRAGRRCAALARGSDGKRGFGAASVHRRIKSIPSAARPCWCAAGPRYRQSHGVVGGRDSTRR